MEAVKKSLFETYSEVKNNHDEAIVLVRARDHYVSFEDDARLISNTLGVTLSSSIHDGKRLMYSGFPHHLLDSFLPRLVRSGHRIAICDEL